MQQSTVDNLQLAASGHCYVVCLCCLFHCVCRCCWTAVGLSYSTHHADYATNDTATAADSHAFLRAFFERYPHLQQNDFYISGESRA